MTKYTLADILTWVINIFFGVIVVGLVLRFILKLFAANPDAGFAQFMYNSTEPVLNPFAGVFSPYTTGGSVFEFTTLLAIVVYIVIAWILNEIVAYVTYNASTTYRKPNDM